jgi:TolB-like protein/Tfp pilus assembly protein PilF/aminoglycoside phosphotransferase (APT) family kinase protein
MPLANGARLGPYEIQSAIGAGGMGEVYKARDTRLDRTVAIKILPAELSADPDRCARFQREAKVIASLNHPHICTLFDVGEHDGSTYLVMEHLAGESLAERLHKGRLPLGQALGVATEIADALTAAHRQGIIHRDLKPGNVMLTKSGAKLLDFGLARLTHDTEGVVAGDRTSASTRAAPLTRQGTIVGTLQYMAPEQLEAETADERADLWALGAMLYEMVTGRRAFEGKSDAGLVAAILDRESAPITSLEPHAPPELDRLVRQCLSKLPADRPDTAHDVATNLRWIRESIGAGKAAGLRLPGRLTLRPAHVLAAVVLLALAIVLWQNRGLLKSGAEPKPAPAADAAVTIAVLPFADLSANHDQEYFSDGLAEELLNALGRVPGLRVTARVSSFRFKGANPDVQTIGQKLNVANLLEGSVRKDGRRLRIGVQLVDAQNGFQRWSAAYERQMDDIFAVQEEIARSMVAALQITLLASPASIVSSQTKNPEAYNAVLQARHFSTRRGQGDLERAAASFRKAIELDPNYASAWVGLAETHHRQADNGDLPVEEGYRMARQAVDRALALAPDLAYAHAEMGWIMRAHDWDWEGADAAYQRALALEPGSRAAVVGASVLAFTLGRLDEALGLDARAIELDPLSVGPRINLGIHLYYAGRLGEAAGAFTKALELSPDFPITGALLGRVHLLQGRSQEALVAIEREPDQVWRRYGLCLAHHAAGRAKEADAALAAFVKDYRDTMAFQIAEIFAYRGKADEAFQWLDRAFAQRDGGMADLKNNPLLKSLEGDPRHAAIFKRMRLPL